MAKTVNEIRNDLKENADPHYKLSLLRFFKHTLDLHGVPTPTVRRISAAHFSGIKKMPKTEIFAVCESLLASGKIEERTIAFDWAWRLKRQVMPQDFKIFERWLARYARDWGGVDDLCTHALGYLVHRHPFLASQVRNWSRSPNWWMRRASAVALIYSLRRDMFLKEAFGTADTLLTDEEDLVQKGYGWMLKVASQKHQREVFEYVMRNKSKMPRTALRYAIEKMPGKMRKQAME
jgi:3-methyladenine DNA glycosylase AlkD